MKSGCEISRNEISTPHPRFHEMSMAFTPATTREDPEDDDVQAFQTTMAARPPDVQRHTGAEYEAGRVHRHLMNEEQPIGGMLRTGGGEPTAPGASPTRHRQQNAEQMDLGLGLGDCNSPAHSTQASVGEKSAEPSPRDVRAAALLRARQLVTTRTTSLPHSASRAGKQPQRSAEKGARPVRGGRRAQEEA